MVVIKYGQRIVEILLLIRFILKKLFYLVLYLTFFTGAKSTRVCELASLELIFFLWRVSDRESMSQCLNFVFSPANRFCQERNFRYHYIILTSYFMWKVKEPVRASLNITWNKLWFYLHESLKFLNGMFWPFDNILQFLRPPWACQLSQRYTDKWNSQWFR